MIAALELHRWAVDQLVQGPVSETSTRRGLSKICGQYIRSPSRPFPPPLDTLAPTQPDPRLTVVAQAFVRLQGLRQDADYDLGASFTRIDVLQALELAEAAQWHLDEIRDLPETAVFLTALLLADRWNRRG